MMGRKEYEQDGSHSLKQYKRIYTFIIHITYAVKPEKCFANDNESDVMFFKNFSEFFLFFFLETWVWALF